MMYKIIASLFFMAIFAGHSALAAGDGTEKTETAKVVKTQGAIFFDEHIAGKLQIGTRSVHRVLTDSDSGHKYGTYGTGTYLGTIYGLDEVQSYVPNKFFLAYFFTDYVGVELAYDSIKAETLATEINTTTEKSDGDANLYGPTLSVIGRLPTSTPFTPYASFGLGFYSGDFDEEAHWALGYSNAAEYEAAGSPATPRGGRVREIVLDDAIGIILGAGCTYAFNPRWMLDLSATYTQVDTDATFNGYNYGVKNTEQDGNFPMDNFALRVGVVYQF